MRKYIIACDSFKGCLSSEEVGDSIEKGVLSADPDCTIVKFTVADGGEGTILSFEKACLNKESWRYIPTTVHGPNGKIHLCQYACYDDKAIIEVAQASGLTILKENERNPLICNSYGTGEQIMDAISKGYRNILIGLGGSACNDAGCGILEALGFRFFDKSGKLLHACGASLRHISHIDDTNVPAEVFESKFTIACDVNNPLYGKNGAAHVFARQKGADEQMIQELDHGLEAFSKHMNQYSINRYGVGNIDWKEGAGAAGGIGAGLMAFLSAEAKSGIDLILDALEFDKELEDAQMIITGEGHMDSQTTKGKAALGILRRAQKKEVPVLGICGKLDSEAELLDAGFYKIIQISDSSMEPAQQMDPQSSKKRIEKTIQEFIKR